jgi:hypothetical protein
MGLMHRNVFGVPPLGGLQPLPDGLIVINLEFDAARSARTFSYRLHPCLYPTAPLIYCNMNNGPVVRSAEAYMAKSLFKNGIGHVLMCRFKSDGSVDIGVFLLDVWCLGIKNTIFTSRDARECPSIFERVFPDSDSVQIAPAKAKKLVQDLVAWTQKLGLPQYPDASKAMKVFKKVDSAECQETFAFGKDGLPFYVQGPYETSQQAKLIHSILMRTCGEGKFHYILNVTDGEFPK